MVLLKFQFHNFPSVILFIQHIKAIKIFLKRASVFTVSPDLSLEIGKLHISQLSCKTRPVLKA